MTEETKRKIDSIDQASEQAVDSARRFLELIHREFPVPPGAATHKLRLRDDRLVLELVLPSETGNGPNQIQDIEFYYE